MSEGLAVCGPSWMTPDEPPAVRRVLQGVDPVALDRVAAGLRDQAARLGETSACLGRIASTPADTWKGLARNAVDHDVRAAAGQVQRGAAEMEAAAGVVARTATQVREAQAQMTMARTQWVGAVNHYLAGGYGPVGAQQSIFQVPLLPGLGGAGLGGAGLGAAEARPSAPTAETQRDMALAPIVARMSSIEKGLAAVLAAMGTQLGQHTPVGPATACTAPGVVPDVVRGSLLESQLGLAHDYRAATDAAWFSAELADVGPGHSLSAAAQMFFQAHSGDAAFAAALAATPGAVAGLRRVQDSRTAPPSWAKDVHAWWTALPEQQRHALLSVPAAGERVGRARLDQIDAGTASAIGWLGGIPAVDRDAASRAVLAASVPALIAYQTQLRARRQAVAASAGSERDEELAQVDAELARVETVLTGSRKLQAAAGEPAPPGTGPMSVDPRTGAPYVYVLGYDPHTLGHTAVSYGNPDTAQHTTTYVPGLTTTIGGVDGDLERARRTWAVAQQKAPDAAIASIYWLGYDAPQVSPESLSNPGSTVLLPFNAEAGAPHLTSFMAGLGGSHDPGVTSHRTIVGHSYGSLVTGKAAATQTVPGQMADDLVFVGSPGVGVDHAADLKVAPGHVHAGEGAYDPVSHLAPARDLTLAPPIFPGLGIAVDSAWNSAQEGSPQWWDAPFGTHVTSSSFGADVFPVQTTPVGHAHSSYWDVDADNRPSVSLRNIAGIAVGAR